MIAEDGDALVFAPLEEIGRAAFAIKEKNEAVVQQIGREFGYSRLAGHVAEQAGNKVGFWVFL